MRNFIDILNEAMALDERAHELYTGNSKKVMVIESPNSAQLQTLLNEYHDLRGLIDDEGHCFIWPAMQMTHYSVEMSLGLAIDIGFFLNMNEGKLVCRWQNYSGSDAVLPCPSFQSMVRKFEVKLQPGIVESVMPGFQNKIHNSGLKVGSASAQDHITEPGYVYRTMSVGELEDAAQKGMFLPNPSGKSKGGMTNAKHWLRANQARGDFYRANLTGAILVRVPENKITVDQPVRFQDVEVLDNERGWVAETGAAALQRLRGINEVSLDRTTAAAPTTTGSTAERGAMINVPVKMLYPFRVHDAGAGEGEIDASRTEDNNQIRNSIAAGQFPGNVVLNIDMDRKLAHIADGNHRCNMAFEANPNMKVPLQIIRFHGVKRPLPTAKPYRGEFDAMWRPTT